MLNNLKKDMEDLSNKERAVLLSRFFKTGKGDYGEGDKFIGLTMPMQRSIAKKYADLPLKDVKILLKSQMHEHRMVGWIILTIRYETAQMTEKSSIFNFAVENISSMNNWDLVDVIAPRIIGVHLLDKNKNMLYKFAKSENLWKKRISIIATFPFIKKGDFSHTFAISKILLNDRHDLIHKAAGWMLREIGKINQAAEEKFLAKYYRNMPRTMLRYAIERFSESKRRFYMQK